jgi:hypothetical protein
MMVFSLPTPAAHFDVDGRLHVRSVPIFASGVFNYLADEMHAAPRHRNPLHEYKIWRSPDEVAQAAYAFSGLPIVSSHLACDEAPKPIGRVGETRYAAGYVLADITLWDANGLRAIGNGAHDLSSGFHYQLEWGDRRDCDARQYNLRPNHLALTRRGRNGPAVSLRNAQLYRKEQQSCR